MEGSASSGPRLGVPGRALMALVSFDHIGGDYIVFALELLVVVVVDAKTLGEGC